MEYIVAGIVFGLCFFIVPVWAYRKGLKDGLAVSQGRAIEPIKNPVQVVQENRAARHTKAEQDRFREGLNNLLSYDGSPQEVKKDK